ncbi:MAG: sigma-54-dependent Fis family transcriptional regulator [Bacteroidia bacterium]|nr:sigma-54-dependent Fis family transcriptional regulator [Bacteroidia bacterium]
MSKDITSIKQRFGIIGVSSALDHAINIAVQVAPTDLTVLITGESGVGKEAFPQIVHHLSARKHGPYIAVNCGAIPEGTIDSELFGHEKGSFTGAHETRKGYFEVANGGTIFLDEVAELPHATQARLLRVLESGEFIKVGSSKVQKTDVRIVAATNVQLQDAIGSGKFREDLFYRLNTVPIHIPSLRERKEDIQMLVRKFAVDFAEKHRMPSVRLTPEAEAMVSNYRWPGNVRQLKNVTEQLSILEQEKEISSEILGKYLPADNNLPVLVSNGQKVTDPFTERELLYKVLFDMKKDIVDLKKLVADIITGTSDGKEFVEQNPHILNKLVHDEGTTILQPSSTSESHEASAIEPINETHEVEESLSIAQVEKELIKKAIEKHKGKRKHAAKELGISERTLYRKLKEYNLS